jgi:hypothetical protein
MRLVTARDAEPDTSRDKDNGSQRGGRVIDDISTSEEIRGRYEKKKN